jgi:hypothetical protein
MPGGIVRKETTIKRK